MLYQPTSPTIKVRVANWAKNIKSSMLQEMLSVASKPGILSFALGLPAPELFPSSQMAQAATQVLSDDAQALQYGPPYRPLKAQIVAMMRQRGVDCREEQILITGGAQQGMNLLTRLLLNPGGQVVVEKLTYTGFHQILEQFQPGILTVPTDYNSGIDVESIEKLLRRGARPALIYVITDGHNPLGVSLSLDKRIRLVKLARQYCVPIIEDDAYGLLNYDNKHLPPLRALDEDFVFYIGSFSKILAPGLRVGWLIVPESLIPRLSIIKEATDINTSTFAHRVVSAYLAAGHLEGHLTALRREYRVRRDIMINALREHFPCSARWHEPTSGVFIWVELNEGVDTIMLLKTAVEEEQVAFIPGAALSVTPSRRYDNCIRLNFSNCAPEFIKEGIARLARVSEKGGRNISCHH
jgi:2-aminoadipate transaminase